MIQGLWDIQFDTITDVKIGGTGADADVDTYTYKYKPMTSLLSRWEKIKKDKHGKHCNNQRNFFTVCSLSGQNTREGRPSRALSTKLSHGRERGRTPFSIMGVGKRTHRNRRCEVRLTDDPRSLATQSPTGTGNGLGSGIGDWASRLYCMPR